MLILNYRRYAVGIPTKQQTPAGRARIKTAVQNVGKEAQNRIEPGRAVFRQVNSPQNTDRYSDDPGKSKQFQRADDCVRHSAAKRSDWRG